MLVLSKETLLNPSVLATRSLPRRFLGRVAVWPRGAGAGAWARIIFEAQFLRYIVALLPFVVIMLFSRDAALPVAHAPLPMVALIIFVEMRVLRISDSARGRLIDPDMAEQRLETLGFRARRLLRDIAARQVIAEGDLHLVIEQSDLARVAPLTLVTVQTATPTPRVLDLDADMRAVLRKGLFDADLTERDLQVVNLSQKTFIRTFRQEARAVSAHARLAARLDERRDAPAPGPTVEAGA